jgi:hypothetical protein
MYDPKVGRWLSEDPVAFAADDANLYRYVSNQALDYRDPSGLVTEGEVRKRVELAGQYDTLKLGVYQRNYLGKYVDVIADAGRDMAGATPYGDLDAQMNTLKLQLLPECDRRTGRWHVTLVTLHMDLVLRVAQKRRLLNGTDKPIPLAVQNFAVGHEQKHRDAYLHVFRSVETKIKEFDNWFQKHYSDPLSRTQREDIKDRVFNAVRYTQPELLRWLKERMAFEDIRQALHLDFDDYRSQQQWWIDNSGRSELYATNPELEYASGYQAVEEFLEDYARKTSERDKELVAIMQKAKQRTFPLDFT